MKKLILIIAIIVSFTNCKKSTTAPSNSSTSQVTCIFIINGGANTTGRYFYKCVNSAQDLATESVKLSGQNLFHEDIKKSTCNECQ